MANLEDMSKGELLTQLRKYQQRDQTDRDVKAVIHELEVYREEARVQTAQLIRAQTLLEQSRDLYADLYDHAPLAYITIDEQGVIEQINLTGADLLGRDRPELLGVPLLDYVIEEDQAVFHDHLHRCRTQRGTAVSELRLTTADGRTVPALLSSRPTTRMEGGATAFRTAVTDLTERRRAEQALREREAQLTKLNDALQRRTREAERRADQLRALAAELTQTEQRERRRLAQTLHDHLQQLLVAAKMQANILRSRAEAPPLRQSLEKVDDLLNQSISASRSLTTELSPPILYEGGLVAGLQWLARQMQEKHNLEVEAMLDEEAEPAAEPIRILLFEAVRELLFNVVKHAQVDRAWLTMTRAADNTIRVVVEDAGRGFEPDTTEGEATRDGFGLFSIQERLELLGGRLTVDSAPDQGTTMTLLAPRGEVEPAADGEEAGAAAQTSEPAPRPPRTPDSHHIRVLLADDHKVLREGLVSLLRDREDVQVVAEASDGEEAVRLALQHHPDVVIMDITMPRLSGIEATRRLTTEMPDVSVIGLSLHEEADMAQAMYDAGAKAFLNKAGPSDALLAAIHEYAPNNAA